MKKICRLIIIIALSTLLLAIMSEGIKKALQEDFPYLHLIGLILVGISLIAVEKMRKSWIIFGMISLISLLAINLEFIVKSVESHSISLTIIGVSLCFMGFNLIPQSQTIHEPISTLNKGEEK